MFKRSFLCLTAALAVLSTQAIAQSSGATAEGWPTRPIRLIVPSSPGAGSDLLARAMAQRLSTALKQQVIVDNRPGASGVIATNAVRSAAPDGYTLLYSNASATVMLAALNPEASTDFTRDVMPVALTAVGGVLLLVNPSLPVKNLAELIAFVKANPDKYTYGSWAVGSNGHLTMEWLKQRTGMKIAHVAYKSISTELTEMMAGILQIGWTDPVSPVPFVNTGKLRAIAVNGGVRIPQMPGLPTMGEQGFPFPAVGWQGIFAPNGTPQAIISRIHDEVNRIQATEELQSMMVRMNIEAPPIWSTEQFRDMIRNDLQVWKKIVADGKITPEK